MDSPLYHQKKRIVPMASFEKAWEFTSSWEGANKPYEKRDVKQDKGDYLPYGKFGKPNYTGTAYGITAQFLRDYRAMPDTTIRKVLPTMDKETAKTIWQDTRWKWIKGDDIKDQDIANLIFDYVVQSNITAFKDVAQVILDVYKLKNVLPNLVITDVLINSKIKSINPNASNPNDALYQLTDRAIEFINSVKSNDILFDLIKKKRIKAVGNTTRVKALVYGNILTQQQYEAKQDSAKTKPKLTAENTEGGKSSNWGLIFLALGAGAVLLSKKEN